MHNTLSSSYQVKVEQCWQNSLLYLYWKIVPVTGNPYVGGRSINLAEGEKSAICVMSGLLLS